MIIDTHAYFTQQIMLKAVAFSRRDGDSTLVNVDDIAADIRGVFVTIQAWGPNQSI